MPDEPKVTWPMYCRAAARLDAYNLVLDWIARLSIDEVRDRIAKQVEKQRATCDAYERDVHA